MVAGKISFSIVGSTVLICIFTTTTTTTTKWRPINELPNFKSLNGFGAQHANGTLKSEAIHSVFRAQVPNYRTELQDLPSKLSQLEKCHLKYIEYEKRMRINYIGRFGETEVNR